MLEKNLQALSIRNPGLAQKLRDYQPQNLELVPLNNGDYNLIYNGIPLHDHKEPQFEASLIFGEEDKNQDNLYMVFGLGLGYLFKRVYISSSGCIILYEPSLDVLNFTLTCIDFSEEISDSRVFVIQELSDLIQPFYRYAFNETKLLYLNSYKQMYPDLLNRVYLDLNKYYVDQKTNLSKLIEISNQFISNMPYMITHVPVGKMKDLFKDKSALVVSAGPSLDKAIHTIKKNQDNFIIICIGQALKALYNNGIQPHFVVMIDSLPLLHQLSVVKSPEKELNLVLYPTVSSEIYQLVSRTKFTYFPGKDFMSEWLAGKLDTETFEPSPTVSICAFHFAKLLGASSIILIGQDLAYSEGQIYAKGTIYDSVKINMDQSGVKTYFNTSSSDVKPEDQKAIDNILKNNVRWFENVIQVKGQKDNYVYTSNSYASFISLYEEITSALIKENPKVNLYNASIGGAYLEGFNHLSLDKILELLPENQLDHIDEKITALYKENTPDHRMIERLHDEFNQLIKDLKLLKEDSVKLLKLVSRLIKDFSIHKTISESQITSVNKINSLYTSIKKRSADVNISFIFPLIQKELFECNKLQDKKELNSILKFQNDLKSIKSYSNAMILGIDRVLQEYYRTKDNYKRRNN